MAGLNSNVSRYVTSARGDDRYWSRRRVLRGGATVLGGGVGLALAGCSSTNNTPQTSLRAP